MTRQTIPPHARFSGILATGARFECDERLRLYPGLVRRDRITARAATIDTECWDAMASMFESAAPLPHMLATRSIIGWADIVASLDRATTTRDRACERAPADAAIAARRGAVAAIDVRVRPAAKWFIASTTTLRALAAPVQHRTAA